MRTLHVITSVNPAAGGPIEGLIQLGRVLKVKGHVTEIVCLDSPSAPWVINCPLQVHAMGPGRGIYGYSNLLVPWLKAHHMEYDAVFVRGIWQFGSFATWIALHATQTRYFVFPHGMLDPWFKQAYPIKHIKKVVYWLAIEHRILRDAQGVCFTSEEECLLSRKSFQPYHTREIIVNYGTAAPEGDPQAQRQVLFSRFPELKGKKLLLFLSRIHPKKGCDLLIEAFAKVAKLNPLLHLVIAGPDQTGWQAQLQQQADRLGIANRVTWPGMVSGDLKWGAYHAAEAFVLPSHQENFGIVVAEALACELPVLISNKVNIWREIEEARAGFVAPDTAQGTLELLQKWLNAADELKLQMSKNAGTCFLDHFEIHQAAQSLLDLLQANGIKA